DGDLGRWVRWLLVAHAQCYHRHYHCTGHVWQGRYKAFPVQDDDHLIGVLRYVERNALRAELVARAEDWKWASLPGWLRGGPVLWRGEQPVRDSRWLERGRPYGDDSWTKATAQRLWLESTLRARGRPRKRES